MPGKQKFWNPVLETLAPKKIKQLQLGKFKKIFRWTYENSTFHRRLYDNAGIKPQDVQSFEDIQRVPKVEKSMMRDIQRKAPFPYGEALCVPLDEVTIFRWEWWMECWSYILWAQGYRPQDRVFIPFGYNIFVAFWAGHYAAEKIGCEVIPGGVLDTKARILKIQELQATAMMGTPTYILGMAETARLKMDMDPAQLPISKITCAGECGASIPSTKKRLEEAWGAKVYDHAGATEIGAWSFECADQPGGMHVNEALFLVEIEDIQTGEIIEAPGRRGKMVITALDRMAQPCVRFDSKDVIEWAAEPCSCGRTSRLIKGGVVGRADDITKVKGVLLAPSAIEEVVRGIEGLGDEYEVIVEKAGDADRIKLRVEVLPQAEDQCALIENELVDQLRLKTNLRYDIEICGCETLPRYEVKAKRFKDLRKKE
jgi:phenylacetate-CoA ligase